MNRVRILAIVVVAVVAGWTSPASAEVDGLTIVIDRATGEAWATGTVACEPGDVELDVFLTQDRAGDRREAFVEVFDVCPTDGTLEFERLVGGDPLRLGAAATLIHERQYCAASDFDTCLDRQTHRNVPVRPSRSA